MYKKQVRNKRNRWLTIPNILSMFRLLLIPVIIWLYFWKEEYIQAAVVIMISGITDMMDGYIARKLNMVSNVGKVLDPIADKLTQAAVLICLGSRYRFLLLLVLIMAVKETVSGLMTLATIKKTKEIKGADWHGKVTTCLLYFTMLLHLLWVDIPNFITIITTALCMCSMLLSFALYFCRNVKLLREKRINERTGRR